jgi:predicted RNase H-related nuclease YkuK (DUF458 family)
VPNTAIFLPTLLSRFYLIKTKDNLKEEIKSAEEFLKMSLNNRINFVKELVKKPDEDEKYDLVEIVIDSTRSKAIKFLNALEKVLHQKLEAGRVAIRQIREDNREQIIRQEKDKEIVDSPVEKVGIFNSLRREKEEVQQQAPEPEIRPVVENEVTNNNNQNNDDDGWDAVPAFLRRSKLK